MINFKLISVILAIVLFIIFVAYKIYKKQKPELFEAIIVAFAAGACPQFILLIMAAINPIFLPHIDGLYLAIAGLTFIFVLVKNIYDKFSANPP